MPFTIKEFIGVFKSYNNAVWPFQIILFISALFIIYLGIKNNKYSDKVISIILIFYWTWIGLVYHILFFSAINPAAYIFGIIFILQAALFYKAGIWDKKLNFIWQNNLECYTGLLLMLYALIIYPLIGIYSGRVFPENPTFGLPCPTTIFTFGILLWNKNKFPVYVFIIPFLWSIFGFSAVVNLGIKEDTGLLISAILVLTLIIRSRFKLKEIKPV